MYQNRFGGRVLPDTLGELTCSPRLQPQWGGLLIMGGKEGEGPPTSKGEGREEREDRGDGKREERNRDGTGSHSVNQRPSDPGIQRHGDPVDPVTPFYNERKYRAMTLLTSRRRFSGQIIFINHR